MLGNGVIAVSARCTAASAVAADVVVLCVPDVVEGSNLGLDVVVVCLLSRDNVFRQPPRVGARR